MYRGNNLKKENESESLHCISETNLTLKVNYMPIKIKQNNILASDISDSRSLTIFQGLLFMYHMCVLLFKFFVLPTFPDGSFCPSKYKSQPPLLLSFLKNSPSSSDLLLPRHVPSCTFQNMLVHLQLLRIVTTVLDNTGTEKRSCEAKHTNTCSWVLLTPPETYFKKYFSLSYFNFGKDDVP